MKGPDPIRSVHMMAEANLLEIVFACPADINPEAQAAAINRGLGIV